MAKRKTKNESAVTSIETSSNEQQDINGVNKEIIEDNKKETEYIITKKSEGVYIRKLRRL